ncbi:MAG TPA: hypothetical protein VNG29_02000 [Candidatus Paceibacterota bacterium]|nr:hypothetical protein [Candidatus Paceibacterota bacterium]
MKTSTIAIIIVIAIALVGGLAYWYSTQNQSYAPTAAYQPAQPSATPTPTVSASGQSTTSPQTNTQYVVTYTDSGFSPSTITVPEGGTVIFKNAASDDVRVASNPHPIHNGYPTTGGCVGSTFDSCSNIAPGGSWSFTFTFVGSWGYHNHLNPGEGGTVVVR